MASISLRNVVKRYGSGKTELQVIHSVNAEIAQRLILHARWYASQRSESRVARCGTCGRWARGRMVFLDGCRDSVGRGHAGSWAGAMPGHGPAKVCPQH